MRKYLLLSVIILQFVAAFGQCTATKGEENNQVITYFKCENGYKSPKGFEWMKPTKVYMSFANVDDRNYNPTNTILFVPYSIGLGDNLNYINQNGGPHWS